MAVSGHLTIADDERHAPEASKAMLDLHRIDRHRGSSVLPRHLNQLLGKAARWIEKVRTAIFGLAFSLLHRLPLGLPLAVDLKGREQDA